MQISGSSLKIQILDFGFARSQALSSLVPRLEPGNADFRLQPENTDFGFWIDEFEL